MIELFIEAIEGSGLVFQCGIRRRTAVEFATLVKSISGSKEDATFEDLLTTLDKQLGEDSPCTVILADGSSRELTKWWPR